MNCAQQEFKLDHEEIVTLERHNLVTILQRYLCFVGIKQKSMIK